jgi:hypothetical protein
MSAPFEPFERKWDEIASTGTRGVCTALSTRRSPSNRAVMEEMMQSTPATTHWLLIGAAVHDVGPHVLGSYRYKKDADSDQAALGGTLLELELWGDGPSKELQAAYEWLLPDGAEL